MEAFYFRSNEFNILIYRYYYYYYYYYYNEIIQ